MYWVELMKGWKVEWGLTVKSSRFFRPFIPRAMNGPFIPFLTQQVLVRLFIRSLFLDFVNECFHILKQARLYLFTFACVNFWVLFINKMKCLENEERNWVWNNRHDVWENWRVFGKQNPWHCSHLNWKLYAGVVNSKK